MERLLVPALPRNPAVAVACASISIVLLSAVIGCKQSYGPDVVATVNGQPIQRSEVEKLYREDLGNNKEEPSKEQAEATRQTQIADSTWRSRLLRSIPAKVANNRQL